MAPLNSVPYHTVPYGTVGGLQEWMEKLQEQSYYKTLTEAHVESAQGVDFDECDGEEDDLELLASLVEQNLNKDGWVP